MPAAKRAPLAKKKPAAKRAPGPPAGSLAAELLGSTAATRTRAPVPYGFVLEALEACDPVVRPMFGAHAVYVGERIVLILRKRETARDDNGVWLATTAEHHASLKREFPTLRSIRVLQKPGDTAPTGWQLIPADSDDFDESVQRVCALVRRGDPRVGKVPGARKKAARKG